VTCICGAALRSSLFTGTTCTIIYRKELDSEQVLRFAKLLLKTRKYGDSFRNKNRVIRLQITFFGLLKEFSSITLLDVITVAVEPKALTLA
jgi:hypothetical protein